MIAEAALDAQKFRQSPSCPGHTELNGLNKLKPFHPRSERPSSNLWLSWQYRDPRGNRAMTPQVKEEQSKIDSEIIE